jgi:WD40 repeat protein
MADGFGTAYLIGFLLAFLLLAFAIAVAVVLAVLSWRLARRGDSFVALAFPVSLPLWGIVCAAIVQGPSSVHYGQAIPLWVGICTLAAVSIMGRALWLRPGADITSAAAWRIRRWEITVTAVGAGLLYVLWVVAGLRSEYQSTQKRSLHSQQEAVVRAAWVEGRIAAAPRALCYSPDGRYLATADTHLEIWDLATGRVHRSWPIQVGNVNSIPDLFGFDGSGTRLALSVSQDIEIFDLGGDRKRLPWIGSRRWTEQGRQVRFFRGRDAVVGLHDGKAEEFEIQTGQAVTLSMAALQDPDITSFAVSDDGTQLATWSHRRKRIAAWTISGSQPSWTADGVEVSGQIAFAFSADGQWLALATRQNQIVVWNAATGAEQLRLEAGRKIWRLAFSADGSQIVALSTVSVSSTGEPLVHIWSLPAGQAVVTHRLPVSSGSFMALSPDGQEVAIVDQQYESSQNLPSTVRRFATATGVEHRGFPASSP